jgi:hypothetical protein
MTLTGKQDGSRLDGRLTLPLGSRLRRKGNVGQRLLGFSTD